MSTPGPLTAAFVPHLPEPVRAALPADAALEATLEDIWARARAAWPDVALPVDGFMRHLATRLTSPGDVVADLRRLHATDLYLAYGCAVGDPAALSAFERTLMPQVTTYLTRRDALTTFSDEVKQQLRQRLLVASDGPLPRIAAYSGRGPLGAWLRVATARLAINLRLAERPAQQLAEDDPIGAAPIDDPEMAHLRAAYGPALREAIRAALTALEPREATALRLFFLEGMTQAAIARVLRSSERTVRRTVAESRERILTLTRENLSAALSLPARELDTIIRLARDELAPSIVAILKEPGTR